MGLDIPHRLVIFPGRLQRRVHPPVGQVQEIGPVLITLNNLDALIGPVIGQVAAWAKPLAAAKYVKLVSFHNPEIATGQKASWYPWPYVEGLTIEEATNELAFLVTGLYGKPVPKQNGAPLRLAVPWKYGFKSTKGIVRFEFTDQRPVSFWEEIQGREYGFWANVNPEVPHPRWSQASERVLGKDERVPTLLYNGYGEYVAQLYEGLEGERLFM